MTTAPFEWTTILSQKIRAACVWEVNAPKPGNVHSGEAFLDMRHFHFLRSAHVTAPVLAQAHALGVGRTIREAVAVTNRAVGRNTNLGIILLLAPLAAVPSSVSLQEGIEHVLAALTVEDARLCYEAIREAKPGGLGRVDEQDVAHPPSVTLREAMRLAADRDRIAAQYANGFFDVLDRGFMLLETPQHNDCCEHGDCCEYGWDEAIVLLHLRLMAELPDTLIARKCGMEEARECSRRAQRILDAGWPESGRGYLDLEELDRWLRADGNRRNPGTTADLVAAILFAAMRDNRITLPDTP